ncbi:hypothetical protein BH23BAC1_BH23BAC1_27280 [soil metagenome]|jgi:hypothetical protein
MSALLYESHQPHFYFQQDNFHPEINQQVAFYAQYFNFDETVHIYFSESSKLPGNILGYTAYIEDEENNNIEFMSGSKIN